MGEMQMTEMGSKLKLPMSNQTLIPCWITLKFLKMFPKSAFDSVFTQNVFTGSVVFGNVF